MTQVIDTRKALPVLCKINIVQDHGRKGHHKTIKRN